MTKEHSKNPWPTKMAMQQIYSEHLWGSNGDLFYSGEGSHNQELIAPYIKSVRSFLRSLNSPITLCDLGCGDFNIGKQLVSTVYKYIAVDIVPELIAFNRENFAYPNVEFRCLDLSKDLLPQGDCALLRQVLQHLSNSEIIEIVKKLDDYSYVILTEHLPQGEFIANKDQISGQGIRLKRQSGVNILKEPFGLKVKEARVLLKQKAIPFEGYLVTTLFQLH